MMQLYASAAERFWCDPNTDDLEELQKQIEMVKGSAAPSQDSLINLLANHRLSSLP
jgi:hypothetical protein